MPKISVGDSFTVALISGEEGGVSIFYVENFLSHSADENFRRRILYCCNKFGYRKKFGGEGGGEVSRFSVNNFLLTVPTKNSVGESFIVVLISGIEKVWSRGGEGWEYQVFPLKIFCLTVPKISIGESFSVALIFGEEGGGGIKSLRRNVFVSQCRKFP